MAGNQRYLIALGSNIPHHRHGSPAGVLHAALAALAEQGLTIEKASRIIATAPLGPSKRRFANSAAIVSCRLMPDALMERLEATQTTFGKRAGQPWGARVLDLDIVLWEGGTWASDGLAVPHISFRQRDFVLTPAVTIAPRWRDPVTGLTLQHLHSRLTRPRPARR